MTDSHKLRDPALAVIITIQAVACVLIFVWLVFTLQLWIGVRDVGTVVAYAFGIFMWLYPIGLITAIVLAWRAYRRGDSRRARWLSLAPYIWVVPMLVIIFTQG